MSTRRIGARAGLAALVLAAIAATGCGGSGGDKAGGSPAKTPLTLTLATHDTLYAYGTFAAAVERLSGGSIRIEVLGDWRPGEVDYERGIIQDVRDGKTQLAIVGVRVWDKLGVTTFRPVLAPFLVDSLALERRALQSDLAALALEGVDEAGVVGIAVVPGTLRRPLGLSRPLVRPKDYSGATIGIRLGGVAEAGLRALGAKANGYTPGVIAGLDGAELDLTTVADSAYDEQARALTANVVLWPRIQTVMMNRAAFDVLAPEQQEILRRAGREALEPELARIERDEKVALAAICRRAKLKLVTASASELAALRAAVQPVYDKLERDPQAKKWISEIAKMREDLPAAPAVRCAGRSAPRQAASQLEGRWHVSWTREELLAAGGIAPNQTEALGVSWTMELANGRYRGSNDGRVMSSGTYTVEGDIIRLVFERGIAVQLGKVYELRWSVYHDSLTFSPAPGRDPLALSAMFIKPFARVR